MTTTTPASASAAPINPPAKPQPGAIPATHLQSVLAAFNACNLASCYIERGNLAAARRKLVQALASVNQVSAQGGAV